MPDDEIPLSYAALFVIGVVSGLMIGLALGIAEALSGLSPRVATKTLLMGGFFGAGGGILGLTFGNVLYNLFFSISGAGAPQQYLPSNVPSAARLPNEGGGPLQFFLLLIGRGSGWALIGAFIGVSPGVAVGSVKKMINGAVGGLIGGGVGGSVFEVLVWMNRGGIANFPPPMIRFISFAITGVAIGLFIGLVEELTKVAWLVKLVGRNEGKEYVIFKPETILGRSEEADIPVFTDPDVAERHARVVVQGKRHTLEDLGSFAGTRVNNQSVSKVVLRDGDMIEIGKTRFIFKDRSGVGVGRPRVGPGVSIPTSQHVCPFCGSIKDVNGNCECSIRCVGGSAPMPGDLTQPSQSVLSGQTVNNGPGDVGQPDSATPSLKGISGPYAGWVFALKPGMTVIGREVGKDIVLSSDNTVSRNHAHIIAESGAYTIKDLDSSNGTYVNNVRVTQKQLRNGDIIQIGSTKLRFEM